MKKFISGFLAGAVLFGAIGIFAASYVAEPASFKILVNGREFSSDPPALVVEGRTYLPLRALGEALGVKVNWNSEQNRVEIGEAPQAQGGSYSRNNPAPLNTIQTVKVEGIFGDYTAGVRIISAERGDKAWEKIKAANMFNSPSDDGYEYILAYVAFGILSSEEDKGVEVSWYGFKCFSSNNEEYPQKTVVAPEPRLEGMLFPGGNTEGYVVFQVKKDDPAPKAVFGMKYDGSGGVWFSLQ